MYESKYVGRHLLFVDIDFHAIYYGFIVILLFTEVLITSHWLQCRNIYRNFDNEIHQHR